MVLYRAVTGSGETISVSTSLWGPYVHEVGTFITADRRIPPRSPVVDTRLRSLEAAAALSGRIRDSDDLPPPAELRALAVDLLREQVSSPHFRYAEDEAGDPIEYWEELEADGIPVFDILWGALRTPFGAQGDVYFWPRSSAKPVEKVTDEDLRLLLDYGLLASEEIDEWFATGEYPGWRAEIRADGAWLSFLDEKP